MGADLHIFMKLLFKLPGPLPGEPKQWKTVTADGMRFVFVLCREKVSENVSGLFFYEIAWIRPGKQARIWPQKINLTPYLTQKINLTPYLTYFHSFTGHCPDLDSSANRAYEQKIVSSR